MRMLKREIGCVCVYMCGPMRTYMWESMHTCALKVFVFILAGRNHCPLVINLSSAILTSYFQLVPTFPTKQAKAGGSSLPETH